MLDVGIYYLIQIQMISSFVFLFQFEKNNFKQNCGLQLAIQIFSFFICEITWHKGLEFGQYKFITNLKEVAEYIN
jgi:hypothetical protein